MAKYHGFISYSQAADRDLAAALQVGLQRLARPWYRPRAIRVFRDESSLSANPDLWASIRAALDQSDWLLLLASPGAAVSSSVRRELDHWLATKSRERILVSVTHGSWQWDPVAGTLSGDAVPEPLRGSIPDEPRYVDLRWVRAANDATLDNFRFREAVAELAAPMHGVAKDELESEDIREHRRARRLARGGVTVLVLLLALSLVATAFAFNQRHEATTSAHEARRAAAVATERGLAVASNSQLQDHRFDLGLLLGVESYRSVAGGDQSSNAEVQARNGLLAAVMATGRLRGVLKGQEGVPSVSAYSSDGALFASGSARGGIRIWDVRRRQALKGPPSSWVTGSGWLSMNRRRLLAASDPVGSTGLWDLRAGRPWRWQPPMSEDGFGSSLALSDRGLLAVAHGSPDVAVPYTDSTLNVWDTNTGVRVLGPLRLAGFPLQVVFSRDGRQAAIGLVLPGAKRAGVQLVDVASRSVTPMLVGQTGEFSPTEPGSFALVSLGFSRDGSTVSLTTARSPSGTVTTWEVESGRVVRASSVGSGQQVLAGSHDGSTVAVYDADHQVTRLEDAATGSTIAEVTAPGGVGGAFSPSDQSFSFGTTDGSTLILSAGPRDAAVALGNRVRIDGSSTWSALSADRRFAAGFAGFGKELQIIDVATGDLVDHQPRHVAFAWAFGSDDSLAMLTAGGVRIWDLRSGRFVRLLTGQPSTCKPDTDVDLFGQVDQAVALAYAGTPARGRVVVMCPRNAEPVVRDGQIDTKALNTSAYVSWRLGSASPRPDWRRKGDQVGVPVLDPDSTELAIDAARVSLWNPATGRLRRVLRLPAVLVGVPASRILDAAVGFSSDGDLLAVPKEGGAVAVVGSHSGVVDRTLAVAKAAVPFFPEIANDAGPVAFSPDGSLIAAWTSSSGVQVWETATGSSLGALDGRVATGADPGYPMNTALAFTQDGRRLVAVTNYSLAPPFDPANPTAASLRYSGSRSFATTWDVDERHLVDTACSAASRNLSRAEWKRFIGTERPYQRTCTQWPAGK